MVIGIVAAAWGAAIGIHGDTVALTRGRAVEVYEGGRLVDRRPIESFGADRLLLTDRALLVSSAEAGTLWVDGTLRRTGLRGDFAWTDAHGVAWSPERGLARSLDLDAGVAERWTLPAVAGGSLPVLPPDAPPVLHALRDRDDCLLVGDGAAAACPAADHVDLRAADGTERRVARGRLFAAGPAGLVVVDEQETRFFAPDGALRHSVPARAAAAGVGREQAVLLVGDDVWTLGVDGPPVRFSLAPAGPDDRWEVLLPAPAVRVESGGAVAWLAADDLRTLAALPIAPGRSGPPTPVPGGVRFGTDPSAGRLRRLASDRWAFEVDGRTAWELARSGSPGPLAPGRAQLFFGADGALRAFYPATGRERWALPDLGARAATVSGDRVLVTGPAGWALVDLGSGRALARGEGPLRDTLAFPAAFVDGERVIRDRDGRGVGRATAEARALGVLPDGGVVTAEQGAIVVRDGERVRWWQLVEPGSRLSHPARVVGDGVVLAGSAAIVRLDGRTGAVTAAVPWTLGAVRALHPP